ncbi:hypothetical protein GQ44DRAFT_778953 [Phaeosphaeriaceae sp. PMI808]|nr:hypothetical protein GQ44DRAFT_778953 [Phaeosphaeriaceae sp. PMI808]
MLRTFAFKLALLRVTKSRCLIRPATFRMISLGKLLQNSIRARETLITAFDHKTKVDGGRQEFSVYFRHFGALYKFEASAPAYLGFYGVWGIIACWLRTPPQAQWPLLEVDVVGRIVSQVYMMKQLQSLKQNGKDIVPIERKEDGHYLSRVYGGRHVFYDVGGSLTQLQHSMEAGPGHQGRYDESGDRPAKECGLKWGVNIRIRKLALRE